MQGYAHGRRVQGHYWSQARLDRDTHRSLLPALCSGLERVGTTMVFFTDDGKANPTLSIGILAAVSFTLLLFSAVLVRIRQSRRQRQSSWTAWKAGAEITLSEPTLHDVWAPSSTSTSSPSEWSNLSPLSSLFIPDLRPKVVKRPAALPRPTSIPAAARQLPWDTWRDVKTYKVKSKEEIKREILALERGILQVGVVISMPQAELTTDREELSADIGFWELGITSAPWSVAHDLQLKDLSTDGQST
ncbi:hypothetical protein DL96DRAFT_679990 [Flagelloscypha sp. PMI_526]|nr:hypothetical protein DL96DRAFT_679990 [Flagelloscypha sp. PMI_526]